MRKPLRTLLVGAGGYGVNYVEYFLGGEFDGELELVGIADPYASASPCYDRFNGIVPVFDSMEDFFAAHSADFTIVCTPIHLHYGHCKTALENNSHVICEKPFVPSMDAMESLEALREDKVLAVGFQWCYSEVMQDLKKRIIAGEFGTALSMRSYISWPRGWKYYNRGTSWAGKIKSAQGDLIYDSILSNATAHYIQNMLFLLGDSVEECADINHIKAECYRANDIESFDTIVLKGKVKDADVYFSASHATNYLVQPVTEYVFENARIWINVTAQDHVCTVHHKNGSIENLGSALGNGLKNRIRDVAKRICGEDKVICTAPMTGAFTALVDWVFINVPFCDFPDELIIRDKERGATYIKNLHMDLWDCFNKNILPSEGGYFI
ncbi:MAG: Gfo/Idh/MocA family oxidoreductase [Defluviitaleaceae bacterium]|nr:Gfo/Idh/MocA family oxidoreductase [Defluviitaleaceae bacterium]